MRWPMCQVGLIWGLKITRISVIRIVHAPQTTYTLETYLSHSILTISKTLCTSSNNLKSGWSVNAFNHFHNAIRALVEADCTRNDRGTVPHTYKVL